MIRQKLLETNVSWISCTTSKQVAHFPLKKALASIKTGTQKENILRMRAVVDANHAEYDRIKGTLPANIFSGKFEGGHGAVNNTDYNRLMTLDIDKLDAEQLAKVKQDLAGDEYVFSFWLSPSGKGYKGLVLLDYVEIDWPSYKEPGKILRARIKPEMRGDEIEFNFVRMR